MEIRAQLLGTPLRWHIVENITVMMRTRLGTTRSIRICPR
jgi:hypothetical protein